MNYADALAPAKPLRLWPGIAIVAVQWLARFAAPTFFPEFMMYAVIAGLAGGPALILWSDRGGRRLP
jgi:hypothetical protein